MFANNLLLCRLIIRRDRIRIILWLIGILALTVGFGSVIPGMYPSDADRYVMAETLKSPVMVSMLGPVYDDGGYTVGAMYSNFMLLWTAMIFGIMNIFHVVRHTRQDEERGRIEVIRSLPVGRLSNLWATLFSAIIINLVFSVIIGLGLFMLGIESMDFQGSMLFGLESGVIGILFAVVTAIFCQLCSSPRTANALAFAFLGISFLVRAAGDMQNEILACISPLGLILRTKTYVANLWWPVILMILISAFFIVLAFYLCSVRDMGEGIIPARPGKENGSHLLGSAGGLAWRLLRTPFIIWSVTILILGMAYGSIMGNLESFILTNEMFQQIFTLGGSISLTEQFIGFLMIIMAIINTIPILSFLLKVRSQEKAGYSENLLARSVSRSNQLLSYLLIAVVASIVMPVLTALGFWSASYAVMENPIALSTYMEAALVYIPATWLMIGISSVLMAYLPRLTSVSWVLLGYSFFVIYIGSIMKLPEWTSKLSPYGYIPNLPTEELNITVILVMMLISAVLTALGFIGYRNRDMKFT